MEDKNIFRKLILIGLSLAMSLTGLVGKVKAINEALIKTQEVYFINDVEYQSCVLETSENLIVTVDSSSGDHEVVVYDYTTNKAYHNGREISVTISNGLVRSEVYPAKVLLSNSDYAEVYYANPSATMSDFFATIAAVIAVCTATIALIKTLGWAAITLTNEMKNAIIAFVNKLEEMTDLIGTYFEATYSYHQYRTANLVSYPGYTYPVQLFRNKNPKLVLSMLSHYELPLEWSGEGDWFCTERPV